MSATTQFLSPSEAARRLGVSAKALRLYEARSLISPVRSDAGWRRYGPDQMARSAEIVALRALGLSLAQISRVLAGDAQCLETALAAHQVRLEGQVRQIAGTIADVRRLRTGLAAGTASATNAFAHVRQQAPRYTVSFELPWPWGGEPFELTEIRALTYIVGPLGSGKTRLAKRLAMVLPNAAFIGTDRLTAESLPARSLLEANPALQVRVDRTVAKLVEDGASASDALVALLACLEMDGPEALVVDMLEEGLDKGTQEALIDHLRCRGPEARPLIVLTRSSAILDMEAVGAHEAVILCPANHSPPTLVAPYPGSPGYEAVVTCLASPDVRARTQGVIAWRPTVA